MSGGLGLVLLVAMVIWLFEFKRRPAGPSDGFLAFTTGLVFGLAGVPVGLSERMLRRQPRSRSRDVIAGVGVLLSSFFLAFLASFQVAYAEAFQATGDLRAGLGGVVDYWAWGRRDWVVVGELLLLVVAPFPALAVARLRDDRLVRQILGASVGGLALALPAILHLVASEAQGEALGVFCFLGVGTVVLGAVGACAMAFADRAEEHFVKWVSGGDGESALPPGS
jgi:hypothetical protein